MVCAGTVTRFAVGEEVWGTRGWDLDDPAPVMSISDTAMR
jgi:hypothetical protein